jgi:D-alanyl-D-alanine carboxypeptidase
MLEYKNESGLTVYEDPDLQKLHEKYGLPYQAVGEIQLAYALAHTNALGIIVAELDTGEVLYGHSDDKVFSPTEIAGLNRSKRVKLGLWLPK